jgi:hypothetical protein
MKASNCRLERVVFVFEVQSTTQLAKRFRARGKLSKNFELFRMPMDIVKRKIVLGQSKIIINFCINIIINAY